MRDSADGKADQVVKDPNPRAARAALFGIRQAETREAVNNEGRMLRLGLASHVGEVTAAQMRPLLRAHEAKGKLLPTHAQTGDAILTRGRTTNATLRLEQAIARQLALALDDAAPLARSEAVLRLLEGAILSRGQERALVELAASRDRVTGLHGVAGAGKSSLVAMLRQAAEPGSTFVALAPTSSAAANLGAAANIESRTVASLLAGGGHDISSRHVLVLDEAGQLGNRQALRMLEISQQTGARLLLLGDNQQTGAIEQGKAFWLLQQLGLRTAQLNETLRQQTKSMKQAVAMAREGEYASSLSHLDKVASGSSADELGRSLVEEWTRLKPQHRDTTNILVLDNATRLVVNAQIREALKREGVIAAEDARLQTLISSGLSDEEKRLPRFYSGGQVVRFSRGTLSLGLIKDRDYRVVGLGRDQDGRQHVKLIDEDGRMVRWDPRLHRPRQVNVFDREERDLAPGDRIQWRLATKSLDLKNAERGTVEGLDGTQATIRWDRTNSVQKIDLADHKSWDHGYAETVYSAQSKTYARVYVLAPVNAGLVNGHNFYTAITRARFGVKLWTEDERRLAEKLSTRTGAKTSSLEGLGKLTAERGSIQSLGRSQDMARQRSDLRQERQDRDLLRQMAPDGNERIAIPSYLAQQAQFFAQQLDRFVAKLLVGHIKVSQHDAQQTAASGRER
jgi:ATP-dependent exoDNAse (exonuclease V) alpha subunit